jgi:hypothetical protein
MACGCSAPWRAASAGTVSSSSAGSLCGLSAHGGHLRKCKASWGEDAVGLILGLLDAAPGNAAPGDAAPGDAEVAVGAGPLEDLISEHGDELVDLIDRTARQRPDFAASLRSVSLEAGTLRTETMASLARWVHAG